MKKLILAIVVLSAIIASGLLSTKYYYSTSSQLSKMVDITSNHISSENWKDAEMQIEKIEKIWDKIEKLWTVLIDHFEIDNIEMSLKKAKKYIDTKDTALSLGELQSLRFMLEHIYEKEKFNLENIF